MSHPRRRPLWATALVTALVVAVAIPSIVAQAPPAAAATASDFEPGFIISDDNFYDSTAMTGDDVQAFLDRTNKCGRAANCLAAYRQSTPRMDATRYCQAIDASPSDSAAGIIAKVGRACGISQRTLLVMLQKEQGLITSTSPSATALNHALGHACPDTAPCDPAYSGFFFQVYYGARQFQIYRVTATSSGWNYRAQRWNNIPLHPDSSRGCGTKSVFIQNQATAGLYIYTPYTPNEAAMANMYGTGDRCSSYGNRNFWRLWTDWFGDPRRNIKSPVGILKELSANEDGLNVAGWTVDPDTLAARLRVKVSIGSTSTIIKADQPYSGLNAAFPGAGDDHGFSAFIPATPGVTQEVCVTALNEGGGVDTSLGCRAVSFPARVSPRGEMKDIWTTTAGVSLWGWAIDPDRPTAAVDLHIQVDSQWFVLKADSPYAEAPSLVSGAGVNHAWGGTLAVPPGAHRVCVTMINIGAGSNTPFGCRNVTVPSIADVSPKGDTQEVTTSPAGVSLWGWAVDPDAQQATVDVVVHAGSQWSRLAANAPSTASTRAFPNAGTNHGWGTSVALPPGRQWVCVYFLNQNEGADTQQSCREVTVPDPPDMSPVVKLMGAWSSANGITIWGYAADPDSTTPPTDVVVHVDDKWLVWSANAPYAPGASLFPGAREDHGFVGEIPVGPGLHWVCVYALNRNEGKDSIQQCAQVSTK